MANITRFDPFRELSRWQPLAEFEDFFKGFPFRPLREMTMEPTIRIDVTEDDQAYNVKADIPGVSKDDIQVSLDGNQVSIEAEVKRESEEKKGEKVVRSERYEGRQYRAFTLAHEIDADKAEAKYENGVLQLRLPKKANGAAKQLKIR